MNRILRLLTEMTGLGEIDLQRLISTAPRRYKVYSIPKRRGGTREIAQPSRELKLLQRILIDRVLSAFPVHSAARAYREATSIRDNAHSHAGAGPILKLDFRDFFPSIHASDWITYCSESGALDEESAQICASIFFRRAKGDRTLKLSIGAPSSPVLSNALLYRFDCFVEEKAKGKGIIYTRYADDMTFSGQRIGMLRDMELVVRSALKISGLSHLQLNVEKTTYITGANRRTVTGLVLSNDGDVGIGRDRRRLLSAQVHHAKLGRLDIEQLRKLSGYLAFVNTAEPTFLTVLTKRYGKDTISRIKAAARVLPKV